MNGEFTLTKSEKAGFYCYFTQISINEVYYLYHYRISNPTQFTWQWHLDNVQTLLITVADFSVKLLLLLLLLLFLYLVTVCTRNKRLEQKNLAILCYPPPTVIYFITVPTGLFCILDSNKQRTRIRRKVSIEKELLQKVVTKYNQLVGESAKVSLESIENRVFPWHVTVSSVDDRGKNNC